MKPPEVFFFFFYWWAHSDVEAGVLLLRIIKVSFVTVDVDVVCVFSCFVRTRYMVQ